MLVICFADLATPGQGLESVLLLVILVIVSLAIALFFIINGYKVRRVLQRTTTLKERKKEASLQVTTMVALPIN